MKIKLGPIATQYRGTLRVVEQDEASGRVVLRAEGRDSGGGGTAKATITARLDAQDAGTRVETETDLAITGRVAQMGRGLLAEVSGKMMDEFAANLEAQLAREGSGSAPDAAPDAAKPNDDARGSAGAPPTTHPETGASVATPREVEAVDLLAVAGAPLLRRLAPLVVGAVALVALLYWLLS